MSLIKSEQDRLLQNGTLAKSQTIQQIRLLHPKSLDDFAIGASGLGFDSLAKLDLILRINQFLGLDKTGIEDYLVVHDTVGEWVDLLMKHVELSGSALSITFQTSGSSGPPKQVTHSIKKLSDEVGALITDLSCDKVQRILSLVPLHHIYGFLHGALLPSALQTEVIDLHMMAPTKAFREANCGDLLIATPYQWEMLGASGRKFSHAVRGVSSGGPSSSKTWNAAEVIGLTGLTEVYGSTETGGIGIRDQFGAPFRNLSHLSRRGRDIVERDGNPLELQDRISWINDETFILEGRKDDVFQVSGVNVSPHHVRSMIASIEGVKDVAVRRGSQRLKAFIVVCPKSGHSADAQYTILSGMRRKLDAVAFPESITFGEKLPTNDVGKLIDWKPAHTEFSGS